MSAALVEASSNEEMARTVRAWFRALLQPGPSGRSRIGSACRRMTPSSSPEARPSLISSSFMPPSAALKPGPAPGTQPTSRMPRALAPSGTEKDAAALRAAFELGDAVGERVERRAAVRAAAQPLAPDHQGLSGPQLAGDALGIGAVVALGRRVRAEFSLERDQKCRRVARGVAGRLLRASVEPGRAVRGDHQAQLVVTDRLAQPQVEDRHLIQRVGNRPAALTRHGRWLRSGR